jgi:hypothetical protein
MVTVSTWISLALRNNNSIFEEAVLIQGTAFFLFTSTIFNGFTSFTAMNKWVILLTCFYFLVGCSEENEHVELYELLSVCYNDFYETKGISASDTLQEFETFLIEEGHLKDNSGTAYRELLFYLKSATYFKLPLKKIDFSHTLLYDNPTDLLYCVHDNFSVDSADFLALDYYKCTEHIAQTMEKKESLDIHDMFDAYLDYLDEETITLPFVRESLLQFFYRWYFTSKYNRDIPIPMEELKTEEALEPVIQDQVEIP